jgi:hypothetical protein
VRSIYDQVLRLDAVEAGAAAHPQSDQVSQRHKCFAWVEARLVPLLRRRCAAALPYLDLLAEVYPGAASALAAARQAVAPRPVLFSGRDAERQREAALLCLLVALVQAHHVFEPFLLSIDDVHLLSDPAWHWLSLMISACAGRDLDLGLGLGLGGDEVDAEHLPGLAMKSLQGRSSPNYGGLRGVDSASSLSSSIASSTSFSTSSFSTGSFSTGTVKSGAGAVCEIPDEDEEVDAERESQPTDTSTSAQEQEPQKERQPQQPPQELELDQGEAHAEPVRLSLASMLRSLPRVARHVVRWTRRRRGSLDGSVYRGAPADADASIHSCGGSLDRGAPADASTDKKYDNVVGVAVTATAPTPMPMAAAAALTAVPPVGTSASSSQLPSPPSSRRSSRAPPARRRASYTPDSPNASLPLVDSPSSPWSEASHLQTPTSEQSSPFMLATPLGSDGSTPVARTLGNASSRSRKKQAFFGEDVLAVAAPPRVNSRGSVRSVTGEGPRSCRSGTSSHSHALGEERAAPHTAGAASPWAVSHDQVLNLYVRYYTDIMGLHEASPRTLMSVLLTALSPGATAPPTLAARTSWSERLAGLEALREAGHVSLRVLALRPLSHADSDALLSRALAEFMPLHAGDRAVALPPPAVPARLMDDVWAMAKGSPGMIVQVAEAVVRRGLVSCKDRGLPTAAYVYHATSLEQAAETLSPGTLKRAEGAGIASSHSTQSTLERPLRQVSSATSIGSAPVPIT